jgi:hypothetical protein
MSEVVRYEIKNFITWTLDFENWHKKIRVGPYSKEHEHWSWLIWLKMMLKNLSTDWSSKRLTMRSKEKKEYYSLILIESIITFYIGYGNRINFFI